MRLTCPNCDAQYEVSDSVIPLHGRDVQCSNCGQTWFQTHPAAELEPADDDDEDEPVAADDGLADVAAGSWVEPETAGDAPKAEFAPEAEPEPETASGPETSAMPVVPEIAAEALHNSFIAPAGPSDGPALVTEPGPAMVTEPVSRPADRFDDDDFAEPAKPELAPADPAIATAAAVAAAEPRRRSLDEAVLSVLREEAERETRARRAAGGLETQTDLNLSQQGGGTSPAPAVDPLPKLRVQSLTESHPGDAAMISTRRPVEDLSTPFEPEPAEATTGGARQSRRDLLPDIEEINSSLQGDGGKGRAAAAMAEPVQRPARRSGFRTGFLLMLVLAALVMGLYAASPALGTRFPAAVPALTVLVTTVDKGRIAVDSLMQATLDRLKGDEKPVQ